MLALVGGARRRLLRQGLRRRPSSAGRARRPPQRRSETDRFSLAAMFVLAAPVPARRHPAGLRHRRAGAGRRTASSARACRRRPASPWLSIVPIAESRSSYNGLLVFVFIAVSALARRLCSSTASPRARVRRGPAWDCGFPDPSPATQYTADSFAQPIRRVFGTVGVPRARAGRHAAARRSRARRASTVELRDLVWDVLYAPIARGVGVRRRAAQPSAVPDHPPLSQPRLRRARRPARWCSRYGRDPRPRRAGRADAAGAAAGAAADRLRAQGQGAAAAPARAAAAAALPRSRCGCCARRWCSPRTPPGCSASRPI